MKKTLSTLTLPALARLFCLLGFMFAAGAHAATLSVSPANIPSGGTVTATWSGIATPTTTDWLAVATPAMANTSYISWGYTTGAASGSVPFNIPAGPGIYELRLFANNGYTRLATSAPFTVGTFTVSGTVTAGGSPTAGVAFTAGNGGTCTSSDGSGQYSCTVPYGWSGSVAPSSSLYAFTPASRSYSNVVANQTVQDYAAQAIEYLSGTVSSGGSPLAGVAFAASNGGSCSASNASGQYSCAVLQGYSGTVTPSLGNYAFTPAPRSYSNVMANQTAQDYAAVFVQLSGTVTLSGSPFAGAALAASNAGTCTPSNASGQYSCTVPQGWSGSVTSSASGYTFAPASRSYTNTVSQSGQDFAAQAVATTAGIFYIQVDHLNTPRLIADQAGNTVWRNDNTEPFGDSVPNDDPSGTGNHFDFPLGLSLYYRDKETGTFYAQQRDAYSADIGRFPQSDPSGLGGGSNTYLYAKASPLRFTDPSGLDPFSDSGSRGQGPYAPGPFDVFIPGTPTNNAFVNSINQIINAIKDACKKCPACTPYAAGTIGYQGPHTTHDHYPIGRPHLHLYVVNQNPSDCKCYWNDNDPDAAAPPPAPGWVDLNAGFPVPSP